MQRRHSFAHRCRCRQPLAAARPITIVDAGALALIALDISARLLWQSGTHLHSRPPRLLPPHTAARAHAAAGRCRRDSRLRGRTGAGGGGLPGGARGRRGADTTHSRAQQRRLSDYCRRRIFFRRRQSLKVDALHHRFKLAGIPPLFFPLPSPSPSPSPPPGNWGRAI